MNEHVQTAQSRDTSLLRRLTGLERWSVPAHSSLILLLYASCATLLWLPGRAYAAFLMWPFAGFVLSGFLNAAHDCVHLTHLRSKTGNRIMGAVWCTPLLVNFTIYRYQHLAHHRYTGVEGDTESWGDYRSVRAYLYALTGIILWRHAILTIISTWKGDFPVSVNNEGRRVDARRDNWAICCWLFLAVVLTFLFPRVLLFIYWLPLLFSGSATMLVSLPEHYGLRGAAEVVGNTRSIRSNRIARFVLWNANYHAEHHALPSIPSLNLHLLHKSKTGSQDYQEENSYLSFHLKLVKSLLSKHDESQVKFNGVATRQ